MAFESLRAAGLPLPQRHVWATTGPGFTVSVTNALFLNSAARRSGLVFQVPKTGTLDHVEFQFAFVSQNPVNGVRVSWQDVTASGVPDNTIDQYVVVPTGSIAANGWCIPGPMTHDGTSGGTKRSVTRGQLLAMVMQFESFVTNDGVTGQYLDNNFGSQHPGFPYYVDSTNSGSTYGSKTRIQAAAALVYSDGTVEALGPYAVPWKTFNTLTYTPAGTPDEVGNRFTLAAPLSLRGVSLDFAGNSNAGFVFTLYDSADTILKTSTLPAGISLQNNLSWIFDADVELDAGTYRLTLQSGTAGQSVQPRYFDVDRAALMDAFDLGQGFHLTQRTDAGAWTDVTTRRLMLYPLLTGVDDGAGGGGGGGASAFASFGGA